MSHGFDMGDWKPARAERAGNSDIYLWIVPDRAKLNPRAPPPPRWSRLLHWPPRSPAPDRAVDGGGAMRILIAEDDSILSDGLLPLIAAGGLFGRLRQGRAVEPTPRCRPASSTC